MRVRGESAPRRVPAICALGVASLCVQAKSQYVVSLSTLRWSTPPERLATGLLARRCPSVGDSCARLCKTHPDGSFTVCERGSPTPAEEAERWGSLPQSLRPLGGGGGTAGAPACDSYLVDPASSHMLVSKTKPCMSKYKRFYTVKLRMAH